MDGFRITDHAALAFERNSVSVLGSVPVSRLPVGAALEAATLCYSRPPMKGFIRALTNEAQTFSLLRRARRNPLTAVYANDGTAQIGVIALRAAEPDQLRTSMHGYYLCARKAMLLKKTAKTAKARLCGAIDEMVDNILEHSEAPDTGMVMFRGTDRFFEVSIADAGVGVSTSLRSNPAFSFVSDAGTAISLALSDGNSRFGPTADRGYGFGTLFRALNTFDAQLRFRSDDYAVEVKGRGPSTKDLSILQKAQLRGFVVSITLTL